MLLLSTFICKCVDFIFDITVLNVLGPFEFGAYTSLVMPECSKPVWFNCAIIRIVLQFATNRVGE